MNKFGLVSVACCSPQVAVGNPRKNADTIIEMVKKLDYDVIVFPELCITGYTCADLFNQNKNTLHF